MGFYQENHSMLKSTLYNENGIVMKSVYKISNHLHTAEIKEVKELCEYTGIRHVTHHFQFNRSQCETTQEVCFQT